MNWKYTDESRTVVIRTIEDKMESCLVSCLSDTENILPPDPPPPPVPVKTLAEQILSDPVELAKLKAALGL